MSTLYMDYVRRGVELLDAEVPDWREAVDPANLHLADCRTCVLGQVFGDYDAGLGALGLGYDDAYRYGFATAFSWAWLTRTWHKVLAR